jgi:hypothetical protein
VKKEDCERLISEVEQSFEKIGLDFYQIMQRAPQTIECWKKYYPVVQEVWRNCTNRERLTASLVSGPDFNPEDLERVLAFIHGLPYFLRGSFQGIAKTLPPPPGGRPRELSPEDCGDICLAIGKLYGQGVELPEAQNRLAQRYGVSVRTIQRAWQQRSKWKK